MRSFCATVYFHYNFYTINQTVSFLYYSVMIGHVTHFELLTKAYFTMIVNDFLHTGCAEFELKLPCWHFIGFNFILSITAWSKIQLPL